MIKQIELLNISVSQTFDDETISLLIKSINDIQIKKIYIEVPNSNNETALRIITKFYDKILNFQTNNIASNDVSL